MYVHQAISGELIRQRQRELARSAERDGLVLTSRKRDRGSVRYRAGWKLVEIGLTLAQTSRDAGSPPLAGAPVSIRS